MNKRPIYLDNMATTPVDKRVADKMMQYLCADGVFGNPASTSHIYGLEAYKAVDVAREQIANTVGAEASEIIFTSGATESNNIALLGAARFYQRKGKHLISMMTEHKSVLDSLHQLEREGFSVTYLRPKPDGLLDFQALEAAITPETILLSVMQVNNEIGVIQDLSAIGTHIRGRGILFHVDAAQSIGRVAIDLNTLNVDLMSFSAHKAHGPKGIGALYVRGRPRVRLHAATYGNSQEQGLRAGTLPTHQIVGMGEAFALAEAMRVETRARLGRLRDGLWDKIQHLPGIFRNGNSEYCIAEHLSITFAGIPAEMILSRLHTLAVSSTSACASARNQPSYVLKAIGLSDAMAYSTIRIALSRFTSQEDIDYAGELICREIQRKII